MVSEGIKTFLSCSHFRSIDYFLESITDTSRCLHMAYECKSYDEFLKGICGHCHSDSHLCSEMGLRANLYYSQELKKQRKESVKMYFATSKKRPFCCKYNVAKWLFNLRILQVMPMLETLESFFFIYFSFFLSFLSFLP